jgi:hypothetical protein
MFKICIWRSIVKQNICQASYAVEEFLQHVKVHALMMKRENNE